MKKTSLFYVLIATALFASSCSESSESKVDMEAVKSEIAAMENAYAVAENASDVDGILAYYADDAHSMVNNGPTAKGIDAIRAHTEEEMDDNGNTIAFAVTDVWAFGNYAVETGTSTTTNASGEVINTGKYMSLFEKRDGKYLCIRDIWNSDMPRKDMEEDNDMDEGEMEGDEGTEDM